MPKLLIINITCNQGSTGKISEQVGLMMKERGWDVYYAHGARRVNPSELNTIQFSSVRGEYFHALKSLLFDADGLGSAKATKQLVDEIKEIKPDVIHIHNIHGYYLNYPILFEYLNSTDIPVVMTLHDCWNFTGHCVHFAKTRCEKWKLGCFDCPQLKTSPRSLIDESARNFELKKRLFSNNTNIHIVVVSQWLKEIVQQSFLGKKDVRVIQNGIDLDVFKPKFCEDKKSFTIVAVANVWTREKGLYDFLELSKYLKDDEFIFLVGFDKRKSHCPLPKNVIPIARTNNQYDLAEIYRNSDVVISLSHAETFGLTIAEGAACGVPGIVYDNTAQPSLIAEGTGYVVRAGDVEGVYNAICTIRKNGRSAYYDACVEKSKLLFDKDKCFEKYLELYDELLSNKLS